MGGTVNVTQDGKTYAIPEEQLHEAVAQGFRPESDEERIGRLTQEQHEDTFGGTGGHIAAFGAGIARGATLGGSDTAARVLGGQDMAIGLDQTAKVNPYSSLAGETIGSFSPIGPAGELTGIGEKIIKYGEGGGVLGRAAYTAGGSAVMGAGQAGGSYLSQVALDDKPLSAEGFIGAMGNGALWGGAAGGALSLASDTLLRAKALFPQSEVTAAAAQKIDQQATMTLSQALDDGESMSSAAQRKLRELRVQKAQVDLGERQQLADLRVQRAQSQLEQQQIRTQQAAAGRKPRRAFDTPEGLDHPAPVEAPAVPASPTDDLMAQLQGTKTALDTGRSLSDLSHRGAPDVSDEALAMSHPDTAKLVQAEKAERMTREQVQDWIKGRKAGAARNAEERGYTVSYESSLTGGKTVGGAPMKVDRVTTFTEESEAAAAKRAATIEAFKNEPTLAERILEGKSPPKGASAADIIEASKLQASDRGRSLDDAIGDALRKHMGEHTNIGGDIEKAAKLIGDHEAASADLAEILGKDAPAGATERAKAYREATEQHAQQSAASSAASAQDMTAKLEPAMSKATGGDVGSVVGKMADIGSALEILKAIGVHVPSIAAIPVIGPVLSVFLKAKAVMGIVGRKGGSVGRTAESVIASKAAATRNRVNGAVKQMLDVSSKAVRGATKSTGTAGLLGYQLFPGSNGKRGKKADDEQAAYHARMDELARAQQPNAIRMAISDRVQTSDPALLDAIVEAKTRELQFIASKAPRQTVMPTLLKSDGDWKPSAYKLAEWGRYVKAAEDPASVLEDVAAGHAVTPEAAETLRGVYPALYAEAQRTLITHAQEINETLPYARRVSLSILFQVPVDGTMSPEHIQFLAGGGVSSPSNAQPAQGSAAPAQPMLSGPVKLGTMMQTALERRAAT